MHPTSEKLKSEDLPFPDGTRIIGVAVSYTVSLR
jgi:hypothetical protein